MDSSASPTSQARARTGNPWRRLPKLARRWLPLSLLIFSMFYGVAALSLSPSISSVDPRHGLAAVPPDADLIHVRTEFSLQSLDQALSAPQPSVAP